MPLFQSENLIYYYPDREKPALKDINLRIEEGEFLLITGGSGSGKSTLARVLAGLIPDFYGGRFGGKVYFQGRDMGQINRRKLAREVGMVFQDPEKQLVMTSVEAEIAFGLENLGLPPAEMSRRVAEALSFLDLTEVRQEFTAHLSGGQKQKLALAAILAMQPRVLVLDEPTSQLDPVAAEEFLNLVKRLNEEMGLTIILIEQRLERCYHLADRVVFMEDGQIKYEGTPEQLARWAVQRDIPFVPPVARIFARIGFPSIPVTVKEGRRLLRSNFDRREFPPLKPAVKAEPGEPVLTMIKVWFTYPNGKEALQDVSIQISTGELVAIMGANGAGKSTLLKTMAGLLKPGRGRVQVMGRDLSNKGRIGDGRIAYLSQNPNDYLFQDTVEEELLFALKNFALPNDGIVDELLEKLNLQRYRRVNPRDLSSGERQRVALASILVTRPRLLVLDEPTRGMDYRLKDELGELLTGLSREGVSVVLVTHDIEFAAAYATRVLLLFAGRIVADGPKHQVLGQSVFYSTQIGKMCRGYVDGVLTLQDALDRLAPAWPARQVVP
ncbi:putative HMP/thiamine import ATP-binding protein YkoD [Moorella thermoacetica]|uniref:Putative HMP/thiamine import ATP-binding protein YkoD n=1 Tax=Neomoorella thermoacetica TaxID=1525 RepID=A0A1J5JNL0_NEOTH|nr:energy-coupling factor transporter ATPase [Moorella thermoacetica]OIQ08299.1 putative HMP/thiamine import ATP-binding protein YkoD [Moorella thermoacetica]